MSGGQSQRSLGCSLMKTLLFLRQVLGAVIAFVSGSLLFVIVASLIHLTYEMTARGVGFTFPKLTLLNALLGFESMFATPFWLLGWIACYVLLPYPSSLWKFKNLIALASILGSLGMLMDWLSLSLIFHDFSWINHFFSPMVLFSLSLTILYGAATGAAVGCVASLTAKWFKTPRRPDRITAFPRYSAKGP